MKLKSYLSLCTVFVLFFSFQNKTLAQENPVPKQKSEFWKKVRFGGGLGLNFGNNSTNISVTPSALYQPNEYIAFGPGLNFTYQSFGDLNTTLYGANAIFIANPLDFLQLSGEIEQLRVNQSIDGGPDIDAFWNTAIFLGGGYRLSVNGNSLGAVGIRYNVLFDENDTNRVYSQAWQPFVRVYF